MWWIRGGIGFHGDRAVQSAYQAVKSMIACRELVPGKPISRRGLAKSLGVSMPALNSAVQRLEQEGLLETRQRSGTCVKIPTVEDVEGSYQLREAFEAQAARILTASTRRDWERELWERACQLDYLIRRGGPSLLEFARLHEAFHRLIAQEAGCPILADAIESVLFRHQTWLYVCTLDLWGSLRPHHCSLVEALCSGDPLTADRAMREHIRYGQAEILEEVRRMNATRKKAGRIPRVRRQPAS